MSYIPQLNFPIVDPSGTAYTGPTPDNSLNDASGNSIFPSLDGLVASSIVQMIGQSNTGTWTAQYKVIDASGNQYMQLLTIDGSGNRLEAIIVEQIDEIDATSNLIDHAIKTYYLYDYDNDIPNLVTKYNIVYNAANITLVDNTNNVVGTDASGNNVYGPITDPDGNPLYQFTYSYKYNHWVIDASGNEIQDETDKVLLDSATVSAYAISWTPFENYMFNNTATLFNFDMFFAQNTGTYPVIQTIDESGVKHYYTVTMSGADAVISPSNLKLSEIAYYTVDASGNMLDVSGNIVDADASGAKPSGAYLLFTADPNGTIGTLEVVDPISGLAVSTPVVIYNYAFADIIVDPDTGEVSFSGPVIVQLNNMLIADDSSVDNYCVQINNLINDINSSQFQFGTLDDYQPLITAINEYTSNLDAAQISLDIDQVKCLEDYAANIQSMGSLFGQLVIQLNSTSLVDSESIVQRIKMALTAIYDGLQNIRSFKLAIGQQNLLKISQCVLTMSTRLNNLYGTITFDTNVTISYGGVNYNPVVPSSVGALFNLQENLWYFADGLPLVSVDVSGATYYQSWSNSAYWFISSYYADNFDLSASDKNDIDSAYQLIDSLNNNIANSVNIVMANPNIQDLQSSLSNFCTYSDNLTAAKENLIYKLASIGWKLSFRPTV